MAGIDSSQSAGVKKYKDTQEQGVQYFFTDPTSPSYGTAAGSPQVNPLWQDHRQVPLLRVSNVSSEINEHDTPVPLGEIGAITQKLFQFLGDVISLFGKLLRILGVDAQFDAINTKGYFTSEVNVTVRSLDQILPRYSLSESNSSATGSPLVIKAKAAVQSNNWNAGSTKNATAESRGLVVSSLLSPVSKPVNNVLSKMNDLMGEIPLLKIKLPAMPEFGYVEDDLIPFEHLEGNTKKLQGKAGLYSYE